MLERARRPVLHRVRPAIARRVRHLSSLSLLFLFLSLLVSVACEQKGAASSGERSVGATAGVGAGAAAPEVPRTAESGTGNIEATERQSSDEFRPDEFRPDEFRPGQQAPTFELSDLAGGLVGLQSYRGKVVLVNFWATWCVPCVAEMPSLERLAKRFESSGRFVLLGVNVDSADSNDAVKQFVKTYGITFPIVRDPELEVARKFGVTGFPESFFMDTQGRFLSVKDPETSEEMLRIVSDRPWDSPAYLALVEAILERSRKDQ